LPFPRNGPLGDAFSPGRNLREIAGARRKARNRTIKRLNFSAVKKALPVKKMPLKKSKRKQKKR